MDKKESIFEYKKLNSVKRKKEYEPIKPEPAFSPLFWGVLLIFIIFVLVSMFWDYIKSTDPSAILSVVIFLLFIVLNVFSGLKRRHKRKQ